MKPLRACVLVVLSSLAFLSGCSTEADIVPPTPETPAAPVTPGMPASPIGTEINVDSDFWFGTITQPGASGFLYGGLGFTQTGNNVTGVLAYASDANDVEVCCALSGTIQGQRLSLSYVDSIGDSLLLNGMFSSSGLSLTGSLVFVIGGVQEPPFMLNFSYQEELDSTNRMLAPQGHVSIKQYYKQLKAQ